MIVRLLLLAAVSLPAPAAAQQLVRLQPDLPAQLYRPAGQGRVPAVAIFHGCGGVGINNTRMAGLLRDWGYAALVVDSFTGRGLKDVCGRNWPTQADAEKRTLDIDAADAWLAAQPFVAADRIANMGYSYGGGVVLLHGLGPHARISVLVYPDCGLGDALGPALEARQPLMFAMGALDDWTPPAQCEALTGRLARGREMVERHVYPEAHHSFDALGLSVRYLAGVGNRSKPGGCCGAHYGANEAAWKAFVADARDFLARHLARPQ